MDELKELALVQLAVTDTKAEWMAYIVGVTDTIFALCPHVSIVYANDMLLKLYEDNVLKEDL